MNRRNNIDQLFAPLKDSSEDAPMHLWPEIEAAIAVAPKKKRRFLWFGLFGLLLLASSSLVVYALKTQPSDNTATNQVTKVLTPKQLSSISTTPPKQIDKQTTKKIVQSNVKETTTTIPLAQAFMTKSSGNTFLASNRKELQLAANKDNVLIAPKNQRIEAPPILSPVILRQPTRKSHLTPPINVLITRLPQIGMNLPKNNPSPPEEECAGSRVIKVPKSIFVDAYVSPVFSNTFFTAKTSEASSYAKLRDSTERNGVGILVGARVGYIHESGINLRAGIAYQQIRNKFQYNVEQDEKMIIQIFRDDNGNIIGRDTTFEFGRRRLNVTNKYTTVDIPVSLGYISMKNKAQIGFHIGAVLNLNFRQSGVYLDPESLIAKFSDKKIFEKSIGTSFFGSVELQYLLMNQWGIFIEPQVRFYPKSLTSKGHPIKQNLTNFNVLTGIKYIF